MAARLLSIGQAAHFLGVSIDTLRNWEEIGRITPLRTDGGVRRYKLSQLLNLQRTTPKLSRKITISPIKPIKRYSPRPTTPVIPTPSENSLLLQTQVEPDNWDKVNSIIKQVDQKAPKQSTQTTFTNHSRKNYLADIAFGTTALVLIIIFISTLFYLINPQLQLDWGQIKSDRSQAMTSVTKQSSGSQVLGVATNSSNSTLDSLNSFLAIIITPFDKFAQRTLQTFAPQIAQQMEPLPDVKTTSEASVSGQQLAEREGDKYLEINSNIAVNGSINGLTVTTDPNSITFLDKVTNRSLQVTAANIILNQALTTTSTPTFSSLALSGALNLSTLNLTAVSNQLVFNTNGVNGTLTWTPTGTGKTLTLPDISGTLLTKTSTDTLSNKTIKSGDSNTISGSYPDITGITSLGTVSTGTWNGTKIGTGYGGTNLTTYTTGDILYASAANTLSKLAVGTAGQSLIVSGGIPTWSTVSATGVTADSLDFTELKDSLTLDATTDIATAGYNLTTSGTGAVTFNNSGAFTVAGATTLSSTLDVTGTLTASGGISVAANQNLSLASGTGTYTQTFTGTTTDAMTITTSSLTSGTAWTITGPTSTGVTDHFIKASSDIGSAASLLNVNPDFSGSGVTGYGIYNLATDSTSNGNTDYGYYGSLALTGNAGKTGYGLYSTITSTSTTADTTYGGYFNSVASGAVGSGIQNSYGLYSVANSTNLAGGTVNTYGGYFKADGTVASGTINAYGLYVANGTMNTTGTSKNIGLYVESPTGADTNYAAIFAGGNVGIGTTAPGQKLDVEGTLGILEGGTTPTYHTIFTGGDQIGDINYTLPTASANGLLKNTSGTFSWDTSTYLTSSSAVTSLDTLTGALTISNTTGTSSTITIDDATTAAKGIASFSSTNFSVSSGAVSIAANSVGNTQLEYDTGQALTTSSSPSFTGLTVGTLNGLLKGTTGVLGTATAGTDYYNPGGTDVAVADGGTNKSSWTQYAIPYLSNTTTFSEVGIGTSGQLLTVNGTNNGYTWTTPSSSSGDITAVGSMTSGDAFADSTATGDWLGLGASAGRIEFDDQSTDEVNILNANVGIGTSVPTQALDINGSIQTNGDLHFTASKNIYMDNNTTLNFTNTGSADISLLSTTNQSQMLTKNSGMGSFTYTAGGTTYVYTVGGRSAAGSNYLSTVYKAALNSTGDIQAFDSTGQSDLPSKLASNPGTVTATIGSSTYLYVLGGYNGTAPVSTVYRATLDSSTGNVGAFSTANQGQLPTTLYWLSSFAATYGSSTYIYAIGGKDGASNSVSTVYKATVDGTTGNLGAFSTTSQGQLPQILNAQSITTTTIGGTSYVYVLGGWNTSGTPTAVSTVYKATINGTTGDIGSFTAVSQTQLPMITYEQSSLTQTVGSSTYLYMIGGFDNTNYYSTIYRATLDTSGNVGAFSTTNIGQLAVKQGRHTTFTQTYGGTAYFYVLGGFDGTNYYSTVYKATISPNYQPLSLAANGLVGMGTTAPITNLHIQGTNNTVLRLGDTTSNSNAQIIMAESDLSGVGSAGVDFTYNGTANALNIRDYSTTNTLMYLKRTGNVGIGTTSPGSTLGVNGSVSVGTYATAAAPSNGLAVSGSVGIGTTNPTTTLQIVGGNCSDDAGGGGCTADYAEYYPSSEEVEKGDLLVIDAPTASSSASYAVKRSGTLYQNNIMGIVSTAPAAIADGSNLEFMNTEYVLDPRKPAVALSGRVPLKVSTENGPISAGDYLTSSSIPGVAMKATRPGPVVGKALEEFTGNRKQATVEDTPDGGSTSGGDSSGVSQGKILAFVNISFADPGNFLASLMFDSSGSLVVPVIKTEKILLSSDPLQTNQLAASGPNLALTSSSDTSSYTPPSTSSSSYTDLTGKVASLEERIKTLEDSIKMTQTASSSASLASVEGTSSAALAESTSSATPASQLAQESTPSAQLALTPPELLLSTSSASLANLNITSDATVSGILTAYQTTISDTFKALGKTILGETTIAGDLVQDGTFSISSGSTINAFPTLYLQTSPLAENIDLFNGAVKIDKTGSLTITKLIVSDTKQVNSTTDPTIGSSKILAGQTSVTVTNNQASTTTKIFLTPHGKIGTQALAVEAIEPGKGFTVSLDHPLTADLDFDWWIVETH